MRAAVAAGQPYAVAFIDVRMPPGWDGIETIGRIWNEFPDLQVVICTAYSDYSWDEIAKAVGNTDHVLVLKKPFDNVEVLQMAHALAKKWQLTQIAQSPDGGTRRARRAAHGGVAARQRGAGRRSRPSIPRRRRCCAIPRSASPKLFMAVRSRWRSSARRAAATSMPTAAFCELARRQPGERAKR